MALDGKLLARARERLAARRSENQQEAERRRREVYARVPALRELDGAYHALLRDYIALVGTGGAQEARLRETDRRAEELMARKKALLRANGYPADALDGVYTCPRCQDIGYLPDGRMCTCLRELYEAERAGAQTRLDQAGEQGFEAFDLRFYKGKDLDIMKLTLSTARQFVRHFAADSPNLLFQGGTGLGKTLLGRCVASAVAKAGFSVAYETAQSAFSAFEEQRFSRDPDAAAAAGERVRRILDCALLVLDDLGTEMSTAFTQSALYNIVDSRLNANRKTIIITNLMDNELGTRYLPQTVSRIAGEYDQVMFCGQDLRATRAARAAREERGKL